MIVKEGNVRLVFEQAIFRIPDEKRIVKARITGAATRKGRPIPPGNIKVLLGLE